MKKLVALLLTLTLLTGLFSGCASKEPAKPEQEKPAAETGTTEDTPEEEQVPETVKIRVAYHPNLAPLSVPGADLSEKYFAEEGLEVEWIKFTSGPPEIAAMISGDLQFGYIGHGAHTLAAEGQVDVISLSHLGNSEVIVVREDSGINSMEDLKGKVLATELGTSGEVILDLACKGHNVDRKEIKVTNMQMSGAVSAFIAGQVDAIAVWGTDYTNIRNNVEEPLKVIAQTADFSDQITFPGSWLATPEYIEKNYDVAVRFARALNKCYNFREDNPDQMIKNAAEFSKLPYEDLKNEANQAKYFSGRDLAKMVEDGGVIDVYQKQLDYFIETGKLESGDVNTYVRIDIMKDALVD